MNLLNQRPTFFQRETEKWSTVDPNAKELTYNAKYEDIFAPLVKRAITFKNAKQN
jgi:hypothetical protein